MNMMNVQFLETSVTEYHLLQQRDDHLNTYRPFIIKAETSDPAMSSVFVPEARITFKLDTFTGVINQL